MFSLKSGITKELLNYFFINPQESLYVNELSRKFNLDKRNLVKKLKELEEEGILKCRARGNLKFYSIDKEYPLYREYKRIILKTVGFEDRLRKLMKGTSGVGGAYIYGSYAKDRMDVHSDIDLLVIGNHDILSLQRKLNKFQKDMGRELNIVNMDEQEFKRRIKNKDPFVFEALKGRHIKII